MATTTCHRSKFKDGSEIPKMGAHYYVPFQCQFQEDEAEEDQLAEFRASTKEFYREEKNELKKIKFFKFTDLDYKSKLSRKFSASET